jgi:hypothetical protein
MYLTLEDILLLMYADTDMRISDKLYHPCMHSVCCPSTCFAAAKRLLGMYRLCCLTRLLCMKCSCRTFKFAWPDLVSSMLNTMSASSFNFQILAPECLATWCAGLRKAHLVRVAHLHAIFVAWWRRTFVQKWFIVQVRQVLRGCIVRCAEIIVL